MSWLTPDLIDILLSILKAVVILLVVVTCGAFMSFGERRLLGLFQNRYGPNRVGWGGSLQLVADMIKMFFKEDWVPRFSDRVIFTLAPMIAFTSLLLAFAIVPVSPTWVVADLNIGILFFLMMAGLAVYAVLFAGWSSNNKYSLLGAMRASAQTLSYEVFLGLSLMGVVAQAGSFNMTDIVNNQADIWNVIPQFFGFVTFAIAGVAVCHRHPFDQPEAEQELADGYHIEYSGMKVRSVLRGRVHRYRHHFRVDGNAVLWWLAWPVLTAVHLVRAENRVLHDDVHFDSCVLTASAL